MGIRTIWRPLSSLQRMLFSSPSCDRTVRSQGESDLVMPAGERSGMFQLTIQVETPNRRAVPQAVAHIIPALLRMDTLLPACAASALLCLRHLRLARFPPGLIM